VTQTSCLRLVKRTASRGDGGWLDVWELDIGGTDVEGLDPSILDAEESRRAALYSRAADRLAYESSHLALRHLLGSYLGVAPEGVAYRREPCPCCSLNHGRPVVDATPVPFHFSLSRSGSAALIAVAPVPVGVDIEVLPSNTAVEEVSTLLHPAERAEVVSAPPSMRVEVFARIWTQKEAYRKGLGTGVTDGLAHDYLGAEGTVSRPQGWTIANVPVARGYVGAVAVQDRERRRRRVVRSSWQGLFRETTNRPSIGLRRR